MRKGDYPCFALKVYEEGGLRGWIVLIEYFDSPFFYHFVLISLIVETVMFSCGSNS